LINVTRAYLPPLERYQKLVRQVFDSGWLTNNGQMVKKLESTLKQFLGVDHLFFCANGTITLQIAIKVLKLKGEIITTPFSYVATTNAILWENCRPVFVDIDPDTFCIDPALIEQSITSETVGILATHVYGLPCNTERIEEISSKHNLKVIYDAAHAFGAVYKGKSLLNYGDISSCSFHATKIFHTIEGGALITRDAVLAHQIYLARQFGHEYDNYESVGVNGKNSEMHAAMGLAIFPDFDEILLIRKALFEEYTLRLKDLPITLIQFPADLQPNYAYYPVVFNSEDQLLRIVEALNKNDIFPRRYFYPSLNKLPFVNYQPCPVSERIASTVLCLPLFCGLTVSQIDTICIIIKDNL